MLMFRESYGQLGAVIFRALDTGERSKMKIPLKIVRHYRCHLMGLLLSFPMALPLTVIASNTVRCADGLLSVKVQDITLVELLNEASRQCAFTVVRYVALDQRLSVEFHGLTLAQGLRRILGNRSYALSYAPTMSGRRLAPVTRAEMLWILPRADEKYAAKSTISTTTSSGGFLRDDPSSDVSRLESVLRNGNVEDREQAVIALGKLDHASAVALLSQALADSSAEVREAAIMSLAEIGGTDAAQALAVALRDNDPRVREQAVDALGDVGGQVATHLMQQALRDDVAFVRQAATEMLEQLRSGTP